MHARKLVYSFIFCFLLTAGFAGESAAVNVTQDAVKTIGTGNVTGVYYPVGSAVAKMFNQKRAEYGARLWAKATEGSIENIEQVLAGKLDFGIAQANLLYDASNGRGPWENAPQGDLRAVMGLYTEALTVVAAADAGIGSLNDLRGKRVNIGEVGSSDEYTTRLVLKMAGIDADTEMELLQSPTYEAGDLLQDGKIDAYFYTVGHPNMSVMEAMHGKRPVKLVSLPSDLIAALDQAKDFLVPVEISTTFYPDLNTAEPIRSIGVKAILFTRAGQDPQLVYRVVKDVLGNFDLFRSQYPTLNQIRREDLPKNLILPLHSSAESAYREAGLIQ